MAGAGVVCVAATTPSATALATVRASSSVVNVPCAGRGDGGGDGEGGGGSGRCGGSGGIPPPPNMGILSGEGDNAGRRILLAGRGGTGGRCGLGLGLPEGPARSCCRASTKLEVVARTGLRQGAGSGEGPPEAGAGGRGVSGTGIRAARSWRASACCLASSLASCSCCSRYSTRCCCSSARFWCSSAHNSTLP